MQAETSATSTRTSSSTHTTSSTTKTGSGFRGLGAVKRVQGLALRVSGFMRCGFGSFRFTGESLVVGQRVLAASSKVVWQAPSLLAAVCFVVRESLRQHCHEAFVWIEALRDMAPVLIGLASTV